jgi:hypothetical protein
MKPEQLKFSPTGWTVYTTEMSQIRMLLLLVEGYFQAQKSPEFWLALNKPGRLLLSYSFHHGKGKTKADLSRASLVCYRCLQM